MVNKNHYKKIFIIAAALFVLFAPVGVGMRSGTQGLGAIQISILAPFQISLTLSLAGAQTTTPTPTPTPTAITPPSVPPPNFFSCTTSLATCGVFYVTYIVNSIVALFIAIGAFLVRFGLQINDNIFNSPAVQTGFSVSLAIANLGFVLGIIVIAIATIIRNQTYGIKQLLWKLVFMAILVNFGLVITAPIVGFASSMSNYFINATSPSVATGGYSAYVTTMTEAFAPQQTINGGGSSNANAAGVATGVAVGCSGIAGAINQGLVSLCSFIGKVAGSLTPADTFTQMSLSMVFSITFSSLTAFTFFCLAILLIIRYLMLGGLLIVLPLAWLTYVFPKFDNSFSKWWNTFIKWVFFPPLALFFIYLAFITAANTGVGTGGSAGTSYLSTAAGLPITAANGPEASIAAETGVAAPIQQAADEVLLVGLTIMGLMFANSLAGKAGSTVVGGATHVAKMAAGYIGGRARNKATRAYQKLGGNKLNAALQSARIPLVPTLGRGMANLTEGGTKNLVDERSKSLKLGGMDDDRLVAVTKGLRRKEDQIAAVQEWQKRGKVDKIESIGGDDFKTWLEKNQGTFKTYSQGKLSGDIDKAMGSNDKIRRTAEVIGGARATIGAEEIEKITNSAEVVDKNGIMGLGAEVNVPAKDLAKAGKDETALEAQQAIIDNPLSGAPDIKKAKAQIKKLQDAATDADAAITDAIDKKVDEVDVEDKENLLGRGAGQKAKTGEFRKLIQAESEKFWEGKDKGDAAKMNSGAIFGNKPKFGLTKEALDEIGRSVAHGIITQSPGSMGSLAGKTDNLQQLTKLTNAYLKGIREARKGNKISAEQARKMDDAAKKMLGAKLAFLGGEGAEHTPAASTTPPKP